MSVLTPNVPLLRETLARIEANPAEWDQTSYRCDSGMCFAGWACDLSGGTWPFPPTSYSYAHYLDAVDGDPVDEVKVIDGRRVVVAQDRARRILGLRWAVAGRLFEADNDLVDLRRLVTGICEGVRS